MKFKFFPKLKRKTFCTFKKDKIRYCELHDKCILHCEIIFALIVIKAKLFYRYFFSKTQFMRHSVYFHFHPPLDLSVDIIICL